MIPVTKPFLPPASEYHALLKEIWERNWLTNNGPLVQELEGRLKNFLSVPHLLFTTNGTIALQIAIRALGLKGKIITTPFSYVATASSIVWEGCQPVFADIRKDSLTIDPQSVEKLIAADTSAILTTHVYGNACDIDALQSIASRRGLRVIYDAAHAFGTTYRDKSIFSFGDISIASFHSTKLFHTVEGGAVISSDADLVGRMALMRNFGHQGPSKFASVGINGKNSEFHAAMGLCNLNHVDSILAMRRKQSETYDQLLSGLPLVRPVIQDECGFNYAYYAVLFEHERELLKAISSLTKHDIHPRRYFYPSLTRLPYVKGHAPNCDDVASRVLCLPLYHSMTESEQEQVARILRNNY